MIYIMSQFRGLFYYCGEWDSLAKYYRYETVTVS